ncbi:ABC transporter substrate-binding protein [Chloroflexota bacterium]
MKKLFIWPLAGIIAGLLSLASFNGCTKQEEAALKVAVEFNSHAVFAYLGEEMGWFEGAGLNITAYESYISGMVLTSALARGDIEIGYICLVPFINGFANARIPMKIVAGTHKYGYGLAVNPDKIKTIGDLARPDIRISCIHEGGATDIFFRRTIEEFRLDEDKILSRTLRMTPPKQILSLETGQVDAVFLPEQWTTMAEEYGFRILLTSQDIWPEMQGSVLVVSENLINDQPEVVRKLVRISLKAKEWYRQHTEETAEIVARQLSSAGSSFLSEERAGMTANLGITPDILSRSLSRMKFTTDIDPQIVQETIDYLAELDYIKNSFPAKDILELRFLNDELAKKL